MEMQTAAGTAVASGPAQRPASGRGRMRGNPTLTLLTVAVNPKATAKTTTAVDAALSADLPSMLEVLNPAPAQDSDSITVTAATAAKDHLPAIADLKPYASSMVLGAPPEFKTRSDGIAGLKATYGLTFKSFVPLDGSGCPCTSAW